MAARGRIPPEEALSACERGLATTKHSWNAWAYENPMVAVESQQLLTQLRQQLAWSPDQRYIASSGYDHTVQVWQPG